MWWATSRAIEVYVGTTRLGVRHANMPAQWIDVPCERAAVARLVSALADPARGRTRRLRVWLSAALARPFVVPADSGAQSEDEVRAVAESIVVQETGMTEPAAVWVDVWRPGRDTVAVAIPAALMEQVRAACGRAKVRLASVKPWWNLAIDAAASAARTSDDVLWSLREDDGMTWGLLKAGVVFRAECALPSSHDPDWLYTRQRTQLAIGVGAIQWHARRTASPTVHGDLPIGEWVVGGVS